MHPTFVLFIAPCLMHMGIFPLVPFISIPPHPFAMNRASALGLEYNGRTSAFANGKSVRLLKDLVALKS